MDERDVAHLVELGLTGYEASAYLALTLRGRATAAELARLAQLPRQRIYDVLDGLVEHGLATVLPGRPARYSAAAPTDALAQLLELRRVQLGRLEAKVAETTARLTPAYEAGRSATNPLEFVEILREPRAVAARFAELEAAAEREILVFTRPPYALEPAENVEGLELLRRKLAARSIYERSIYDDPAHVDAVRRFVAAGEQARVVDELPLKLALIDRRVAMFTLQDPVAGASELTMMVVEHPALARLLYLAFDAIWATAEPFR